MRIGVHQNGLLHDDEYLQQQAMPILEEGRALVLEGYHRQAPYILEAYKMYDTAYFPSRIDRRGVFYELGIGNVERTMQYATERINATDPAYHAPLSGLKEAHAGKRPRRVIQKDDPDGPMEYGNCLCVVDDEWLIHPVGPLMDRLRLDHILFPTNKGSKRQSPELDVGDRVRQVLQVSSTRWMARTELHCTMFSITDDKRLVEICRIDLRSMIRDKPSYRPRHVATHSGFGSGPTCPNLMAITPSHEHENVLHRLLPEPNNKSILHRISNLQRVDLVEFSPHPMVLWSAARSFVRPNPMAKGVTPNPKIGDGMSLYSIDLRSNRASFQWSPSAEQYCVEGILSLSGMLVVGENRLLASSMGKMWEIDARMPYKACEEWTLGSNDFQWQNQTGTLLSKGKEDVYIRLDKRPGHGSLQLHQKPTSKPKLYLPVIECTPYSKSTSNPSTISLSSFFPLPESSEDTFFCGLAHANATVEDYNGAEDENVDFATDVLTTFVLSNHGDVYAYNLLENTSGETKAEAFEGIPVGASCVGCAPSKQRSRETTGVHIRLSNQYPTPRNLAWHLSDDDDVLVETDISEEVPFRDPNYDEVAPQGASLVRFARPGFENNCSRVPKRLKEPIFDSYASSGSTFDLMQSDDPSPGDRKRRSDVSRSVLRVATDEWDSE